MRDLHPCPPCGRQGRPGEGFLAGSNTKEPRGSAPRERDHRGGDHPVPSRTRQLSPPSPRVLQRKAAGGQGVALAEGAFLCLRGSAREEMCGGAPHAPGEARRGMLPLRAPFASWAAGPRIRHLRRLRLSVWPSSRRRCGVRAEEPRRELLRGSFRVNGGAKSIRWCWQRSAAVGPAVGISRSAGPFCAMKFRGVCRMLCLFYLRLF